METSSDLRLGPYQVIESLGKGGMGEVYRAINARLSRTVAIKVLRSETFQNADRIHRFEHEAKAASALNHPNILTIYDFGELEGTYFMALEYVEGQTLRQIIAIWRLRPTLSQDEGPRILVQEGAESVAWTPQRVAANSTLREGDRVRISIESPSTGYLYIIDREQYSGRKVGKPYLIFPTTRTHDGDNQVTAGKLIEVPAQNDRPNYFTLHKSQPGQFGEVLTVIVSDKPIGGLHIGPEAKVLSAEQVAGWEQQWRGQTERFEVVGGAGRAWTRTEQQAGLDGTRRLTQDDPGPQTFYRVAVQTRQPFFT